MNWWRNFWIKILNFFFSQEILKESMRDFLTKPRKYFWENMKMNFRKKKLSESVSTKKKRGGNLRNNPWKNLWTVFEGISGDFFLGKILRTVSRSENFSKEYLLIFEKNSTQNFGMNRWSYFWIFEHFMKGSLE